MKKFIVLGLFGLLIMAFSATVYAQKLEFKASGSIDYNYVWERNTGFYFGAVSTAHAAHSGIFQTNYIPTFYGTSAIPALIGQPTGATNRPAEYSYSRGILRFDAIIDPNLSGTFIFELDALRWGDTPGGNIYKASERNTIGTWSTDRAAVEVKNMYIDFGLPYFGIPVPITVRVGAQPFGVRPNMVVYTDGAGITFGIKADPVMIIPMWAKIGEYSDFASDDATMYGLHSYVKLGKITLGGYGLYYNLNTYPGFYGTGLTLANVGATGFTSSASWGPIIAGTQKASFWWFGGYMDGRIGPVDINLDFVYDTGKVKRKLATDTSYGPDVKYSGWAGRAKVDFPWEKFNFGVTGMYATGVDANKTSIYGLPGTSVANPPYAGAGVVSTKVGSYVVPPGSEQSPIAQESIVMYSCFNASADGGTGIAQAGNYYSVSRGSFGGTWFAKLYGSAKLLPWYKVTLQGLYIGDTTKNGNTLSNMGANPRKAPYTLSSAYRDDKTIGWEIDLINEIQIYKNLSWQIAGGWLFAGDALDQWRLIDRSSNGANYSLKDPWNVTTRLLFTF